MTMEQEGMSSLHVLVGDLDLATVEAWQDELDPVCSRPGSLVRLDLSQVTFVDSTGLRMLIRFRRLSEAAGGRLVLVDPPPQALQLFEVAGLVDHFTIDSSA
jgi:anti-anti-sigma factor